jgi:hypothetical protein
LQRFDERLRTRPVNRGRHGDSLTHAVPVEKYGRHW